MGSNTSRPSPAHHGRGRRLRPLIRSLTCGAVFPRFPEAEELPAERQKNYSVLEKHESCRSEFAARKEVQSLALSSANGYKSNEIGPSVSAESSSRAGSSIAIGESGTKNCRQGFGQNKTSFSGQENGNWRVGESSSHKDSDSGSTISLASQMQMPGIDCVDSVNTATHLNQLSDMQGQSLAPVATEEANQVSTVYGKPPGPSQLEGAEMLTVPNETERQSENFVANTNSLVLNSVLAEGSSIENWQLPSDESLSDRVLTRNPESREAGSASNLPVEAVSVSSSEVSGSSGDVSNQEARRTSRRRLWDALTRATSRRRTMSPTILLSSEDLDGLGSSQGRWLLDISSGSYDDPFGNEAGFINDRNHDFGERAGRSQVWALQRLDSGSDRISEHSGRCPSGLHLEGQCTCEAYVMTEETSSQTSISRIVMLVEALFEVLDEIHRQSVALSRSTSLSLVSLPAPDPVVDSFPLRVHEKPEQSETVNEEVAQCHICLVEYEAGDRIRVLPCHHEYHMACADKWLKEFQRVCPLCRGNVCELNAMDSVTSNS